MARISVIGICGKSVFMNVDHFHENGETLIAQSIHEEIGGKGINQAVAASRMGAEVSFLAAVGDDENGKECEETLMRDNIKSYLKIKPGKTTPLAFILTDKNGENRVTEFESAFLTEEDVKEYEEEIAASDILLLQHEVPEEINDIAVKIAKKHNVRVILNPAPARAVNDLLAEYAFAVTPNEHEKCVIDASRFKNCITTLGSKGCCINEEVFIPAIDVKAVDTTGAGDTFTGVLAVCIAEGMSLEESCRYAVTASGISVGRKYVTNAIPFRKETEEFLQGGK